MISLSTKSERAVILAHKLQEMEERLDYLRRGKEEDILALQRLEERMEVERTRAQEMMNSFRQDMEVRQQLFNINVATL